MMRVLICFLLLFVFSETSSFANVGEAFGFGSRISALGGAGVAGGSDTFTTYHNPAGLAADSDKRLFFNFGLVYMQPSFLPIKNILVQNNFNADGQQYGDADNDYKATFGQELALAYRPFDWSSNITLGLTYFIPLSQLAYMDSGSAFIPEYILHRARTQRPQFEIGLGAKAGMFHFGAGIHIGFSLSGNATVFINTRNNNASSMTFAASMSPRAAPYLGLMVTPHSRVSLGGVFRFPLASTNTMVLNSSARVFGSFSAVDFGFTALSTMFYDPMAIELGGNWQHSDWGKVYLQADYQFWRLFQAPALYIQQPSTDSTPGGLQISGGWVPSPTYVNTITPRIGEEIQVNESNVFRVGYAYKPSILANLSNDSGNYLDPPRHMANLGWGFRFKHFLVFDTPCNIDIHVSYQYLVRQHITKTSGNEGGDGNDQKIGYPGYDVGGSIYGGGATFAIAL